MDNKYGYYIFGGLLIGILFGLLWSANGNAIPSIGFGALAGAGVGWFAAAAMFEKDKRNK
jgi:hypothetical protein